MYSETFGLENTKTSKDHHDHSSHRSEILSSVFPSIFFFNSLMLLYLLYEIKPFFFNEAKLLRPFLDIYFSSWTTVERLPPTVFIIFNKLNII